MCIYCHYLCAWATVSTVNRPAEHHQGVKDSNEARIIVDRFDRKNDLLAMISSQRLQAECSTNKEGAAAHELFKYQDVLKLCLAANE